MWPQIIAAGAQLLGSAVASQNQGPSTPGNPYSQIQLPDIEKQKLQLEQLVSTGQLTPEEAQAIALNQQDQLENISLDPRLKQAQMDALSFMQKTGEGNLTPAERAQVNDLRRQVEADSQSRMQALLQQQDARGVGSSDMALAQRMLEAQASANRQAASTDEIAGQAFQRALQSMTQAGNLAGSMEQQDYARQASLAEALRARELANWQNQQSISNQNTQARNAAQEFNLRNQQNISDQNVALRNQQQQYNKELQQQRFNNEITRAGGQAPVDRANYQIGADRAAQERQNIGNIAGGIGNIAGAFLQGQPSTGNPPKADVKKGIDLNDQLTQFLRQGNKA